MNPRLTPLIGVMMLLLLQAGIHTTALAQTTPSCANLKISYSVTESRCTATGSIKVTVTGGSGTYNYSVAGPTTSGYTSSNVITGLQPGTYTLTVKDVSKSCTTAVANVVVPGNYIEPRFGLTETDVTCTNGSDGSISVSGIENGRQPFIYKLVSPSAMGVGTSNSTGTFTGLIPGTYSVQMTDSCGDIQTRTVSIQNYTWSISSTAVVQSSCQNYKATINLTDSKGNTNASGTAFSAFKYGVVTKAGDTTWFSAYNFSFSLGDSRSVTLVAKDKCGNEQYATWTNTTIPSVASAVAISSMTCTTFTATVTGQTNLTNPQYCITTSAGAAVAGQACNSTGVFTNLPYGSYCIKITNTCYDTTISRCFTQSKPTGSLSATATVSDQTCTTFTATATGQSNLTSPQYCIATSSGAAVSGQPCNSTGVFKGLPYGNYTISVTDACNTTPLKVAVTGTKLTRSVNTNVTISGYACGTFNASITGQSNLTNPTYCLVSSSGVTDTCNSTGIFNNIGYGSYCINIADGCGDTTIHRCFTASRPVQKGGTPNISNRTCTGYTLTVSGQANIYNGKYCLMDASGNILTCNSTSVFTNVSYGQVCVSTYDSCTNATFKSCITANRLVPAIGPVTLSKQTCSGFTATVSNQANLTTPQFCLFNSADVQVGTCNSTGVFNIPAYGSYSIKMKDGCTDTTITVNFTATAAVPSAAAAVTISNQTCSTYNAAITGITNLSGATYTLKSGSTVISTNSTGAFTGLSYQPYCIDITDACNDTTIERCFNPAAPPIVVTASAAASCTVNTTDVTLKVTSGQAPYAITIMDTLGHVIYSSTSNSTSKTIAGLGTVKSGQRFKIIVSGSCGTPDTIYLAASPSSVSKSYTIRQECPSSLKANGSDDLTVTVTSTFSGLSVTIVKKNDSAVSIGYSNHTGNTYLFSDLDAATYVLAYTFTGCTTTLYDTVSLPAYSFPSLSKSTAYQCNNNSFSVGAAVTGGIGPYTYEIIASNPATPSIVTGAQSSPIFTINNNTSYNLIRLRATDACGNAALNDVSILPLANTIVTATSDCVYQGTTLSTDSLANATFTWYKKTDATDSVLLPSTDASYTINTVSWSDTGIYVAKTSVNAGCLTRISYFDLDGLCGGLIVLPVKVTLNGRQAAEGNQLFWTVPANSGITLFEVQRSAGGGSVPYTTIGTVAADPTGNGTALSFIDKDPAAGNNYYRLHMLYSSANDNYSNVVQLNAKGVFAVLVYPNPVDKILNVAILGAEDQHYLLTLYNVVGQQVLTRVVDDPTSSAIEISRPAALAKGVYVLKVQNTVTGTYTTYKVQFE